MKAMLSHGFQVMLRHRSAVTAMLLGALLVNLLVVARLEPPPAFGGGDLPIAARCQGGGPGCAEQPMIPPPLVGLPHFDTPPAPVFGPPVVVEPRRLDAVHEALLATPDRPPSAAAVI
jgi:hypothetical protein